MSKVRAVTLFEVLLVIAIFSSFAAVAVPLGVAQLSRDRVRDEAISVASEIQLVQQRGITGRQLNSYGVSFSSSGYTVYKGDSLSAAVESEFTDLSGNLSFSNIDTGDGSGEVTFVQGELIPSTDATVLLSDGISSYTVEINSEGLVHYYES